MMHKYEAILLEDSNPNLPTKFWCKITTNPIFNRKLSKFMKLAEIIIVQMFNSMEDECNFNTISSMKNKLWNKLNIHLDLNIHLFNQHFFILQSCHYNQAIAKWQGKIRYYADV